MRLIIQVLLSPIHPATIGLSLHLVKNSAVINQQVDNPWRLKFENIRMANVLVSSQKIMIVFVRYFYYHNLFLLFWYSIKTRGRLIVDIKLLKANFWLDFHDQCEITRVLSNRIVGKVNKDVFGWINHFWFCLFNSLAQIQSFPKIHRQVNRKHQLNHEQHHYHERIFD